MKPPGTSHRGRLAAGAAMILAPPVIVLAELLHARVEIDGAEQLVAVAEHTGRWYAAHVLILVTLALAVPAFLGLARLLRRARPVLADVSLVAFVPGLIALAAIVGVELVVWEMAQSASRPEMVSLAERLNEGPGILPVFVAVLLFPLAWLLVGAGLFLARAVPAWAALLIALSQPVAFVSELAGAPRAVAVAAQIAFALGLVPVGIRVLRGSDAEWEHMANVAPGAPATS
jgi:hypothetical protein